MQHIFTCFVEKCLKNGCFSSETRGGMKKIGLLLRLRETYCPQKMELYIIPFKFFFFPPVLGENSSFT